MLSYRHRKVRAAVALLAFVFAVWPSAPSVAQTLELPSIVHKVKDGADRIDMVVNSSRHLVMDKKIPQAQVSNPEILTITPLSANKIQVAAKKPGVTQVNLWDEDGLVHTIDVVVFADAQELTLLLKSQFPKAALRVIPLANSVLISGYVDDPDQVTRITEIAQDYHPKVINQVQVGGVQQILLFVRVMEVSRSDLRELGVDFGVFNSNDFFVSGVSGLIQSVSASTQSITATGQTLTMGVVNQANQFNGFLKALRQNDLLKIVAEPNLVCVSGRPAFFNVGGEFPILVPQSLGTVSIQYKKFGTQLDFVPIVLGNNRIRLEVRPRVSEIDNTRSVVINGTTVPGLRVREVETGVEMRAGETLAIAGLVQQRTEAQKRGWPWLGDIPGIGVAFRSVREQVQEIETLVLVTPQFVEAMECHEVPPGGPGLETCSPSHCELWCKGQIEVPCPTGPNGQCLGNCANFNGPPGTAAGAAGMPQGAIVPEQDLLGPPPGAGGVEVVPAPAAGAQRRPPTRVNPNVETARRQAAPATSHQGAARHSSGQPTPKRMTAKTPAKTASVRIGPAPGDSGQAVEKQPAGMKQWFKATAPAQPADATQPRSSRRNPARLGAQPPGMIGPSGHDAR